MSSKEEEILPPDCLWTQAATSTLTCISSLLAHPSDFRFAGLQNHMSQLFKINLYLCIHLIGSISLENAPRHGLQAFYHS